MSAAGLAWLSFWRSRSSGVLREALMPGVAIVRSWCGARPGRDNPHDRRGEAAPIMGHPGLGLELRLWRGREWFGRSFW
jgi:hypothetical protein